MLYNALNGHDLLVGGFNPFEKILVNFFHLPTANLDVRCYPLTFCERAKNISQIGSFLQVWDEN